MANTIKTEFHIHTKYSSDSLLSESVLLLMCRLKKLRCIAITDHNELKGALKIRDDFQKRGITVIPGEEVFSADGEIIGLFLKNRIAPGMSAEETVQEIKKQGGLVYIPHPYDEKRYKTVIKADALSRIADEVDFIECHNGRNISAEFSRRQNDIAEKYGKIKAVGSDAHTFFEIGRNTVYLSSVKKEELRDALKNADFTKKKCLWLSHKATILAKIIKRLRRK
ncbi:MAG: PHP domain-containing protein [Lachnospiraceae bacterium]|nr:PHP domain-containing protein [Lachnospiraceae bacterium]